MSSFQRPARFAGLGGMSTLVLLALTALVYWATVLDVPKSLTVGRAAAPWTDGAEYLDGAVHLARGDGYGIHVAGSTHPSRYPFGFSLVSAGMLRLGVDAAWAPHRANQLGGLLLLAWTVWFGARRLGLAAAALATLLLATLPAFVILCRSPLSEIWGTVLAVSGIGCLYSYATDGRRVQGVAGAALLTASLWFRTSNALLAPFVAAAWLARNGALLRREAAFRRKALHDVGAFLAAAVAALLPLLFMSWRSLGHPLATGYGYWAPYWNAARAFSWEFVGPNLAYYARELVQAEERFTTANLFGQGSYVGPAYAVLATFGALQLMRRADAAGRARLAWFGVAAATYLAGMTAYFYSDLRLLFPLLVLAAPVAAAGWVGICRPWPWTRTAHGRSPSLARAIACALCTFVGLAALVGWPATGGGSPELLGLAFAQARPDSDAYTLVRQLGRLQDREPRLVLTDAPPPYVHALLPAGTWVAPLRDDHLFRFNPEVFVFSGDERRQLVSRALNEGRATWALVQGGDVRRVGEWCRPPAGHVWEIVTDNDRNRGLARLVDALP